jgi:arylsulfatase A-like enzyme
MAGDWERDPEKLEHIPDYQHINGITDPDFFIQRYALSVEYIDQQVGAILDTLEEKGRLDHSIIVLTADHGESFLERPLWFDHGTHTSEEQLHVPLIIRYPEGVRAGTEAGELVGLMDVAPTVIDVLGMEPLGLVDGISLRSEGAGHAVLMGESSHCKAKQEPILSCSPFGIGGKELAARSRELTIVQEAGADPEVFIAYDRIEDPDELHPTDALELPEGMLTRIKGMRGLVDQLGVSQELISEPRTADETEEQEQLEALGYTE